MVSSHGSIQWEQTTQDVINLRGFHSDKKLLKSTGLKAEHIRFNTWNAENGDVIQFLKIISNTNAGPFLIHCQHGADRTGLMSAMYRVLEQGWTVDDALAELRDGGYGYHAMWKNILRYVRSADVDKLRAAIAAPGESTGSTATVTDN